MENNNENDKFWSIKKMLFKEDFFEQNEDKIPRKEVVEKLKQEQSPSNRILTPSINASADMDLMQKIYQALETMNMSGIDFMELWNSMRAMGSVDAINLKNSYTALKIASGNTLTKESLIETGEIYLKKISEKLDSDIALKENSYAQKQAELKQSKQSLETQRNDIVKKIKEYQEMLSKVEKELGEIDSKYMGSFQEISTKIEHGKIAKAKISDEMISIIQLIKTNL